MRRSTGKNKLSSPAVPEQIFASAQGCKSFLFYTFQTFQGNIFFMPRRH